MIKLLHVYHNILCQLEHAFHTVKFFITSMENEQFMSVLKMLLQAKSELVMCMILSLFGDGI